MRNIRRSLRPTHENRLDCLSGGDLGAGVASAIAGDADGTSRILGIDPGSRMTGYGVVELRGSEMRYVASGCIDSRRGALATRLAAIYRGVTALVAAHAPTEMAVEEVFFARNPQSALKLGQARGVAIAAAVGAELGVHEYAARTVKQTVVGSGRASKQQVAYMVRALLSLDAEPAPDAADALAVAICHVNTRHLQAAR